MKVRVTEPAERSASNSSRSWSAPAIPSPASRRRRRNARCCAGWAPSPSLRTYSTPRRSARSSLQRLPRRSSTRRPPCRAISMSATSIAASRSRTGCEATGTDNLLAAGRAAGIRRFVAQSFGGWSNAPANGRLATEADATLAAAQQGADGRVVRRDLPPRGGGLRADWTDGIVLRYGGFYGPGTGAVDGAPGRRCRGDPQAQVPAHRRRSRRLVVHPRRRCRRGDA